MIRTTAYTAASIRMVSALYRLSSVAHPLCIKNFTRTRRVLPTVQKKKKGCRRLHSQAKPIIGST